MIWIMSRKVRSTRVLVNLDVEIVEWLREQPRSFNLSAVVRSFLHGLMEEKV